MNVTLWIVQAVLAIAFGLAGLMKATQPKQKLAKNLPWVEDFAPGTVKLIGTVEVLAALGLILPAATGIATVLTPIAATGVDYASSGALTHSAQALDVGLDLEI